MSIISERDVSYVNLLLEMNGLQGDLAQLHNNQPDNYNNELGTVTMLQAGLNGSTSKVKKTDTLHVPQSIQDMELHQNGIRTLHDERKEENVKLSILLEQISERETRINQLTQEVKWHKGKANNFHDALNLLQNTINVKDRELIELQKNLTTRDSQLSVYSNQQAELDTLREQISERNIQINQLIQEIERHKGETNGLRDGLTELQNVIGNKDIKMDELNQQLVIKGTELSQYSNLQAELEILRGELGERNNQITLLSEKVTDIRRTNSIKKDSTNPSIIFAIERTHAAWMKLSIWAFTIGMLAMNSNQMIAVATLGVRLRAPVFIIGFLLASIGITMVPFHIYTYEKRMRLFKENQMYGNRRGIYLTSVLLFVVMLAALIGSAIYGATEVVQVGDSLE